MPVPIPRSRTVRWRPCCRKPVPLRRSGSKEGLSRIRACSADPQPPHKCWTHYGHAPRLHYVWVGAWQRQVESWKASVVPTQSNGTSTPNTDRSTWYRFGNFCRHSSRYKPLFCTLKLIYVRGDVSFPTIECVPFTHTIHGNFCHPKLGLAKTSGIHSTIIRTVI